MRTPRLLRVAAALLALVLASAPPADAQERDLRIRSYDAELRVNPDGTLDVTETLRVAFDGTWNGIYRDLSLQHHTAQGRRERLRVSGATATDLAGQPMELVEESGDDRWTRRFRIRVPGARDAERTVVIRYRVENAIRFYYAHEEPGALDELYWNVTGNGWGYPIDRVTARILLPAGARPDRTAVYTGYAGATERDATVEERENEVAFASTRAFYGGEGMTVAAGWAPGAIASRPTEEEMQAALVAARRREALRLWPLGLPLLVFLFATGQWRRRGRDPEALPVTVGYEPPDGMSPAELGTLIDHRADMRDVTSTVVDLAVRGHLGIEEEVKKKGFGLFTSRDYLFHLRHAAGRTGLAPHESLFFAALSAHALPSGRSWREVREAMAARAGESGAAVPRHESDGAEEATRVVRLSDLSEKFYSSLPGIRNAIYDRLVERGYYRTRPDRVKMFWTGAGITVGALSLASLAVFHDVAWVSAGAMVAGGLVSAVVLLGFAVVMPARTEAGARAREGALGFREFLTRVESERYRAMVTSPELFERYLPHAMAFGVADRWAKAFEGLLREPPQWYAGGGGMDGFRPTAFASDMARMNSAAQSTMASSPSSSGSSGGGSSGGGSGGGGGGGW